MGISKGSTIVLGLAGRDVMYSTPLPLMDVFIRFFDCSLAMYPRIILATGINELGIAQSDLFNAIENDPGVLLLQ